MKIVLAKSAGFCMGVKRAIAMAQKAVSKGERPVYTLGPLIHNPQELERLRHEGILPLGEEDPAPKAQVIVRAHGVTPKTMERLQRDAETVVDATCPKVTSIQERIREHSERGYGIVIAGDPDHPEVVGLLGYATGPAFVVASVEEVDALPAMERVLLVAQTTQDEEKYEAIRARFLERFPLGKALSTVCSFTRMRQSEIRKMVSEVDAMVVIGGRNSANTRRLKGISEEAGVRAYHIESASELPLEELSRYNVVGVTAGASTPEWIICEVVETLEKV